MYALQRVSAAKKLVCTDIILKQYNKQQTTTLHYRKCCQPYPVNDKEKGIKKQLFWIKSKDIFINQNVPNYMKRQEYKMKGDTNPKTESWC